MKNVENRIFKKIHLNVNISMRFKIFDRLCHHIESKIGHQINYKVRDQIRLPVWEQVESAIKRRFK